MDLVWSIPGRSLDLQKIREAGQRIAASYEGLSVEVEKEDTDCISLFYVVPQGERGEAEVEISIYDREQEIRSSTDSSIQGSRMKLQS